MTRLERACDRGRGTGSAASSSSPAPRARTPAGCTVAVVPRPERALEAERAAVLLDDAARDRDAEARAALFRRVVGLPDAVEDLRAHAGAAIHDADDRGAVGAALRDLEGDGGAARRGLHRVEHEVEERLAELLVVGVERELAAAAHLEGDAGVGRARLEEERELARDVVRLRRADREVVEPAREREEAVDDSPGGARPRRRRW